MDKNALRRDISLCCYSCSHLVNSLGPGMSEALERQVVLSSHKGCEKKWIIIYLCIIYIYFFTFFLKCSVHCSWLILHKLVLSSTYKNTSDNSYKYTNFPRLKTHQHFKKNYSMTIKKKNQKSHRKMQQKIHSPSSATYQGIVSVYETNSLTVQSSLNINNGIRRNISYFFSFVTLYMLQIKDYSSPVFSFKKKRKEINLL